MTLNVSTKSRKRLTLRHMSESGMVLSSGAVVNSSWRNKSWKKGRRTWKQKSIRWRLISGMKSASNRIGTLALDCSYSLMSQLSRTSITTARNTSTRTWIEICIQGRSRDLRWRIGNLRGHVHSLTSTGKGLLRIPSSAMCGASLFGLYWSCFWYVWHHC